MRFLRVGTPKVEQLLNKKKKVIIYTRVSTDNQAETGFSLANQEDLLRRECTRRGFEIVEHYRDDGYSATTFERPAFQRLHAYLKQHKKQVELILVTKWCRFSRNAQNTFLMLHELKQYGTEVLSLDDGDTSNNPSNFLLQMLNIAIPEVDNCIRSRNTKDGIRLALKEGHYPYGMPPKGYSKDNSAAKTPLLVPNEESLLIVEADNDEWWFVVKDIVEALIDTSNSTEYIKKMRVRDPALSERWGQIVTPLSIETSGGKKNLNCATTEGIFRIIQSIPSPKAEPFKRWLAKVGYERIQEIEDPELASKKYVRLTRLKDIRMIGLRNGCVELQSEKH